MDVKYYRYTELSPLSQKRAEEVYKREQQRQQQPQQISTASARKALLSTNELYRFDDKGNFLGSTHFLIKGVF